MRPVELQIEGFGPYAKRQTMDFRDLAGHDLVLIEGPTGAGKTTIFDAISYALYGHVPGARASVMNQLRSSHVDAGAEQTEVSFSFEKGGAVYRVVRRPEYRRPKKRGEGFTKEPASAKLFRLYPTGDGVREELMSGKTHEVSVQVSELVGLDASQFNQVLVLPQGQFRDFLVAQSSQKEQLLSALFGDSLQELVRDELIQQTKTLEREDARLGEKTEDRLGLAGVQSTAQLHATIEGFERALPVIEYDVQRARERARDLARRLGAAEEAHARGEQQTKLRERLAILRNNWPGDLEGQIEQWASELDRQKERLRSAERAGRLVQRHRELKTRLDKDIDTYRPMEQELEVTRARQDGLQRELDDALTQGEALSEQVEAKRREVAKVRQAQDVRTAAAAMAKHLREEQPCPVCGATEHPAPAQGQKAPRLVELEKELATGTRTLEQTRARYRKKRAEQTSGVAAFRRLEQIASELGARVQALRAQVRASEEELAREKGLDPEQAVESWRAIRKSVEEKTEYLVAGRRAAGELQATKASLRALADVSTVLAEEPVALRATVSASEQERETWETHQADVNAKLASFWSIRDEVEALGRSRQRVHEKLRVVKPLSAAIRGQNPRGISLSRYVLQAKMEEVTQAASVRLLRMTDGRYRLKVGQERLRARQSAGLDLVVVDGFANDAQRAVQTLSGGEAFLASLALAMGLSDIVQAHAGGVRMDALFIDEGFGSLDADTLDLAMSAIRELRAGGRLIGLISHVEALKEVVPTHIQVRRRAGGSIIRMPKAQGILY